jgi:hypothetical protein
MKLAAMQPYFFPYLGQFDLLNRADIWIAYDPAQYIRHGWVNRNRVLHPESGWHYIVVPLQKHTHEVVINQMKIASSDWKTEIFKRLQHYHMDAPFYRPTIHFLQDVLSTEETNLSKLNVALFRATATMLGIHTPIFVFSEMELSLSSSGPQNLALELCRAVGATEYINPPGGVHLYSPEEFAKYGILLTIQSFSPMVYSCGRFEFIPSLSIIDVMMWNSSEEIKYYLDTFRSRH